MNEETRMIAFLTWVGNYFKLDHFNLVWFPQDKNDLNLSIFDFYDERELYSMWLKLNPAQ